MFCGTVTGPFRSVEHPIPESLGNDDLILPKGYVCDACNSYSGSKIENRVVSAPPFNVERVTFNVHSKKGKPTSYIGDGFSLHSTGAIDQLFVVGYGDLSAAEEVLREQVIWVPRVTGFADLMVRFLLKIGVELLVFSDKCDPHSNEFDSARNCARYGREVAKWDIAYGVVPTRGTTILTSISEERSGAGTRKLYSYEIGIMPSGDTIFTFIYSQHMFACNLTNPALAEYVGAFNALNSFSLRRRFG